MICRCGNETSAWLCPTCVTKLGYLIVRVDAVVAEVRAVIPRLTLTATYGDRAPGVRAQHAPAPVSVDAVSSLDALQRWMLNTCLRLAEITRKPLTGKTHELLGSYLIANMPRLVTLSWAPDLFAQLETLVKDCERITAVHDPKVFAGRCANCDSDLYAVKGQPEARCGTCSETYEVLTWRNFAKSLFGQHVGTPTDLSRKLSTPEYGIEVTADRIRKWARRDKLERANPSQDEAGEQIPPAYRLNDVLDLYNQTRRKPLDGTAA